MTNQDATNYLPRQHTMTLLLVIDEFAFVSALISVDKDTMAVHLVVSELAVITTSIRP